MFYEILLKCCIHLDVCNAFIIVGEPKSHIVQKHTFLHPKGIRLKFCILIVKIAPNVKPLYSNATGIAFRGKMHFFVCHIGHVKQSFIA